MLWHLLWITLIVVIYNLYRYYHEDDSYDYSADCRNEVVSLRETVGFITSFL